MRDEGFHEIQLNGKQLVFLFMAATVVSVVIFLCGVMVGRGVQSARAADGETLPAAAEVRAVEPARPGEAASTGAPPAEEPAPVVEDDYYDRLVEGGGRGESLSPSGGAETPRTSRAAPPAAETRPARAGKPAPSAAVPETTPAPKPKPADPPAQAPVAAGSSSGFAVQLAALRERGEADAIAKRLVAKGYQAYVLLPAPGAPPVYRVQVGRFDNRPEADRVAARLKKEERFDPWVTR